VWHSDRHVRDVGECVGSTVQQGHRQEDWLSDQQHTLYADPRQRRRGGWCRSDCQQNVRRTEIILCRR